MTSWMLGTVDALAEVELLRPILCLTVKRRNGENRSSEVRGEDTGNYLNP